MERAVHAMTRHSAARATGPGVPVVTLGLLLLVFACGKPGLALAAVERESRIDAIERKMEELQRQLTALGRELGELRQAGTPRPSTDSRNLASTEVTPGPVFSGDARLRYEHTSAHNTLPERNRAVLRARLGAEYHLNRALSLGARVTTGDSDDPNSSDITLGSFDDDLQISLDRAYASYQGERFRALGGKFANPFLTRELVWDGDVNPQGVAASVDVLRGDAHRLTLTGAFVPIDNALDSADSYMSGAQLVLRSQPGSDWSLQLGGAYYDYTIGSLETADGGDIRDNRLSADGSAYLSDFDLLDTIAVLEYRGLGDRWPLRLSLDYVVNLGAVDDQDSGQQLNIDLGRDRLVGDWRLAYAYARSDIDAMLDAFSQDNTTYASNYRQHSLVVAYVPLENVVLDLTTYFYRRDAFQPGYGVDWDEWVARLRMNVSFRF